MTVLRVGGIGMDGIAAAAPAEAAPIEPAAQDAAESLAVVSGENPENVAPAADPGAPAADPAATPQE